MINYRVGSLKPEDNSAFSCYPMDSKEKCVLCSTTFSLFKFAYKCKLCDATCCDDCSKKRVILNKKVSNYVYILLIDAYINLLLVFLLYILYFFGIYRRRGLVILVTMWPPLDIDCITPQKLI